MKRWKQNKFVKQPRRRFTDRLRMLADQLWEKGEKAGADRMHSFAREKEAERERDCGRGSS